MRFLSRPACIRKETRPKAAGACRVHRGSRYTEPQLTEPTHNLNHYYLMQHDGYKDDELHAGLRRRGSGSQSDTVSWRPHRVHTESYLLQY